MSKKEFERLGRKKTIAGKVVVKKTQSVGPSQYPTPVALAKAVLEAAGLPVAIEYRFHPARRWRFDLAVVPLKIAVEIEGGVWTGGRHVRGQGYLNDVEKYNAAQFERGWLVWRCAPEDASPSCARLVRLIDERGLRSRAER